MEHIISYDEVYDYMEGVVCRKDAFFRCLDVLLYKEEHAIDEVCCITTFNSENDGNRCKKDEIAFRLDFPGYEEDCAYFKYSEFLQLIKKSFLSHINWFSREDRKEIEAIIQDLEKKYIG